MSGGPAREIARPHRGDGVEGDAPHPARSAHALPRARHAGADALPVRLRRLLRPRPAAARGRRRGPHRGVARARRRRHRPGRARGGRARRARTTRRGSSGRGGRWRCSRCRRATARDVAQGRRTPVQLLVDGADAVVANQVLSKVDALVRAETRRLGGPALAAQAPPIQVKVWTRYNPEGRSALFMVPGLAVYLLAISAVLLTALTVAGEWERGSMEQLFASPVGRLEIVLGKLLPYLVLGMIELQLVLAFGAVAFDVPIRGSLPLLFGIGLFFLVGMLGQGLLISVVAKNQLVATQAGALSALLPSLLLSGMVFPLENMPLPLQLLSRARPGALPRPRAARHPPQGERPRRPLAGPRRAGRLRGGRPRARDGALPAEARVSATAPVRARAARRRLPQGGPPDRPRPPDHVHADRGAAPADDRVRLRGGLRRRSRPDRGGGSRRDAGEPAPRAPPPRRRDAPARGPGAARPRRRTASSTTAAPPPR